MTLGGGMQRAAQQVPATARARAAVVCGRGTMPVPLPVPRTPSIRSLDVRLAVAPRARPQMTYGRASARRWRTPSRRPRRPQACSPLRSSSAPAPAAAPRPTAAARHRPCSGAGPPRPRQGRGGTCRAGGRPRRRHPGVAAARRPLMAARVRQVQALRTRRPSLRSSCCPTTWVLPRGAAACWGARTRRGRGRTWTAAARRLWCRPASRRGRSRRSSGSWRRCTLAALAGARRTWRRRCSAWRSCGSRPCACWCRPPPSTPPTWCVVLGCTTSAQ